MFAVCCHIFQPGYGSNRRKYRWPWYGDFLLLFIGLTVWIVCQINLFNSYVGCLSLIGDAVVNVYINHEKKFAFVEMRSVEEASNAMALDGIIFEVLSLPLTILYA